MRGLITTISRGCLEASWREGNESPPGTVAQVPCVVIPIALRANLFFQRVVAGSGLAQAGSFAHTGPANQG